MKLTKAQRAVLTELAKGRGIAHARDGDCCWFSGGGPILSADEQGCLQELRDRGLLTDEPIDDDDGMRRSAAEIITDAGRKALEGGDG